MVHAISKPVNYIPSLDGLRAVSIAIVFLSHAGVSKLIPGGFGVTVFFFLSGYLITTLLIKEYDNYGSISISHFYLRRVVRLGPPLLVTLLFAAILAVSNLAEGSLDPKTITSQILFYYNYYSLYAADARNSVDGLSILWSLAVEEHFYIFYPWIFTFLAFGRMGLKSIVGLLVAVLAWRAVRYFGMDVGEWKIYISTDTRIDSILYGCLLAIMAASQKAERVFRERYMTLLLGAALLVLILTFLVRDPGFRSTLRYSLQGLALMPIFYYAINHHQSWIFRPLNWAPVRRIGQYSYTMYLAHFVIIKAMILNGLFVGNQVFFTLMAAILTISYSALVFEFAEKPFKPLRKKLVGH